MTTLEFIESVRQHLELHELDVNDDGVPQLTFEGGLTVGLHTLSASKIRIEAIVTSLPDDEFRAERLLRKILQRSLAQLHHEYEIVAMHGHDSNVWIFRDIDTEVSNSPALDTISVVEDFINHLESWVSVCKDASTVIQPMQMLRP